MPQWVFGGQVVSSDADLDGAVAACGADEALDRPSGRVLDESIDAHLTAVFAASWSRV